MAFQEIIPEMPFKLDLRMAGSWGIFSGEKGRKNHFWPAEAKVAA